MRQNNFQTPMMQNQQMMGGMGQQRNQQQGGMNSYQNYGWGQIAPFTFTALSHSFPQVPSFSLSY